MSSFTNKPMLAFRRNKNLRDLIGQTHISHNKKITPRKYKQTGSSSSACLSRANNQCCKHIISTSTIQSDKTGQIYYIRHNLNCHSSNIIYLGHCCPETQYIGKSEPTAHLHFNTHRYYTSTKGLFDKHFNLPGHSFNENACVTIIDQVRIANNNKEVTQLLKDRKDIWMCKQHLIQADSLNIQLLQPLLTKSA